MMLRMGEMDYRAVTNYVLEDVMRRARKVTDPKGDPQPAFYTYRDERDPSLTGTPTLHRFTLPFAVFTNDATKNLLIEALTTLIKTARLDGFQIRTLVFTTTVWRIEEKRIPTPEQAAILDRGLYPSGWNPRYRPDERTEQLFLQSFEAERDEAYFATVTRSKDAPQYGPWEQVGGPGQLLGRMVEPLREAMR